MKITEHLYKTSGVEWGTNSSTYLLDTGESVVLFDAGYRDVQWHVMESSLRAWGLADKPVSHIFLTHGHYDHAGNVSLLNATGAPVYAAEPDAAKIESGYPEMEELFGVPWVCGKVDKRLMDGQVFSFANGTRVTALAAPGHSGGSFAFVVEADGHRALVSGDMFFIAPHPPEDQVDVELAYMGGWDFSRQRFANTLLAVSHLDCDLLLPGHYYVYHGDVNALARRAYEKLMEENGDVCGGEKRSTAALDQTAGGVSGDPE